MTVSIALQEIGLICKVFLNNNSQWQKATYSGSTAQRQVLLLRQSLATNTCEIRQSAQKLNVNASVCRCTALYLAAHCAAK